MPHEWNNILVVTKDELIPEFFPSWEALRKKLARDEKKAFGLRRARQGKGRGNEVLIAFDSLPEEWQRQLGDPRRKDCSMERFFWEDAEAVAFFSSVRPGKYGNLDIKRQREYVLDASVLYLKVIALSYPFLALYNGGAALFRSMGNSKISMQISFLMNVINIVGNAVCIFGFKMGVDGVAWPSVLSRVVAAALILRKCYQKGNAITVPKTTRLDAKMTKRILGIGIPSAFENSLFEAGRILVVSMISTFGTVQIAANAVANNLDGMGVIPGKALSLAMITVVGRCIGARDDEQAVYYTRKLTVWSYIAMGLSNGAILLFLHKLIGIYALSGETMVLSELLVRIHAGFAILLWTLSFVLPNALRAANDVKFTMIVSILSMAVWRLGFSYLLCVRMGWGAVGVWIAMIIDWVCRVTCFVLRFRSGVWKTKYQA